MRRAALLPWALLLATWGPSVPAAYVTDRLAAGLYAEPREGEPLEVLPSGTPVERLGREKGFCQVRTGPGRVGWIRCRYLSEDPPARQALLECLADKVELREALGRRCPPPVKAAPRPVPEDRAVSDGPGDAAFLPFAAGLGLGLLGGLLLRRR